jgi:hypothetical protein
VVVFARALAITRISEEGFRSICTMSGKDKRTYARFRTLSRKSNPESTKKHRVTKARSRKTWMRASVTLCLCVSVFFIPVESSRSLFGYTYAPCVPETASGLC